MFVNTGSSANIIYLSAFDKLHLRRTIIEPMRTPLTKFTGHSVYPLAVATLWFPTAGGIGEMSGDKKWASMCYQASVPPLNPGTTNQESRHKRRGTSEVNTMTNKKEDNSQRKRMFEKSNST
ncbi:hypothetical protein LIER_03466 [Lithospermum erythrorhizon]|uniref:Uncharacterized protein n=1 Tax=Lithospermum erythrorhizon TaxID=34254 RepID=A0AAV3NXX3_LITER